MIGDLVPDTGFAQGASGPSQPYNMGPGALELLPAGLVPGQTSTSPPIASNPWTTGDYKISAVAADHADPNGGAWLLCNSSAIDATYVSLIALVGANRPDARGRTLVMKGTNAAVSSLLASDGVAVANRRPQHRHTAHSHTISITDRDPLGSLPADWGLRDDNVSTSGSSTFGSSSVDGGSGTSSDALDAPAFLVPGNLFIHT